MPVEPSPDAYGNKARASAVADWIAALAWQEKPVTLASAIDYFGDLNYPEGTLLPDDGTSADAADEEEFSDWVRSVLARRIQLPRRPVSVPAGRRAPTPTRRCDRAGFGVRPVASDHDRPCVPGRLRRPIPQDMFEATVARCLDRRMKAVDLGNLRDAHPSFHDAVFVATIIGLEPSPSAASSAAAARDEGVDTIGIWDWGDRRPGRWTVIGASHVREVNDLENERWPSRARGSGRPKWPTMFIRSGSSPFSGTMWRTRFFTTSSRTENGASSTASDCSLRTDVSRSSRSLIREVFDEAVAFCSATVD